MKRIKEINGKNVNCTAYIYPDGVVKMILRNKLGVQFNKEFNPEMDTTENGAFLCIPIISNRQKYQSLEIDWCDLYQSHYPNNPLPDPLLRIYHQRENHKFVPIQYTEQCSFGF